MAESLGTAVLELRTDDRKLKKGLKQGERAVKTSAQRMNTLMTTAFAGFGVATLLRGFKALTDAASTQIQIDAQLEAGIRSTGGAAGFTTEQLKEMAAGLQQVTTFGDEATQVGQSILLTFTKIRGEAFERTTVAMLDLATRMGGNVRDAAIQLGKALNDPVANLGALGRAGIQFSTEQRDLIKTLAQTNRLAEAQAIILDELENQFGGSAEAAAKAAGGGLKQLWNTLGDIAEILGGPLLFGLDKLGRGINALLTENIRLFNIGLEAVGLKAKAGGRELRALASEGFDRVNMSAGLAADEMDRVTQAMFDMEDEAKRATDDALREYEAWFDRMVQKGFDLQRAFSQGFLGSSEDITAGLDEIIREGFEVPLTEAHVNAAEAGASRTKTTYDTLYQDMVKWAAFAGTELASAAIQGLRRGLDGLLAAIGAGLGSILGDRLGNLIGERLGGAFGDVLSRMAPGIGGMLGQAAGEALGDLLDDLFSGDPRVGTATVGAGGGRVSGDFAGAGLLEVVGHINEMLRIFNDIVGGGIDVAQQVAISISDTGAIWAQVVDETGKIVADLGEFESLADASDAALLHLLQTASLSDEMRQAFQDLIGSASDVQQLFADLKFVQGLGFELQRLGGPAMRVTAAFRSIRKEFDALRDRIESMGLSAEATARLLADVAKAEARRNNELKVSVMSELADLARQFGLNAQVIRRAAVLETRLKFATLRANLILLGLWDRFGDLFRRLRRLALQAARGGEGEPPPVHPEIFEAFQHGSGRFMDFAPAGEPILVHGREQIVTEGEGRSLQSMVAAALRNAGGAGSATVREMRGMRDDVRRLTSALRRNQDTLPAVLAAEAAKAR